MLWNALNEENKVSLFVRYIDIATGKYETKIYKRRVVRRVRLELAGAQGLLKGHLRIHPLIDCV